jgi:hypothetical protein
MHKNANWRTYPLVKNTRRVTGNWRVRNARDNAQNKGGSELDKEIWKLLAPSLAIST